MASKTTSLTNVDRLLLSQAVYELGANSWQGVAKLLTKHPLLIELNHPKNFFTAQSCQAMYVQLMKDAELEITEECQSPRAAAHLKLAQRHFQTRILELRDLISAEETRFKTVFSEIAQLRAAKDARISQDNSTKEDKANRESDEDNVLEQGPQQPEQLQEDEEPVQENNIAVSEAEDSASTLKDAVHEQEPAKMEVIDEEGVTSGDEQPPTTRRSTRRRSSGVPAVPPLQTRSKQRGKRAEESTATAPESTTDNTVMETPKEEAETEQVAVRRQSKRKASVLEDSDGGDKKRPREESEPAEEEPQGSVANVPRARRRTDRTEEQVANKRFQNVIGLLHSQISQHRNGNIFHNPIKKSEAPDYLDIVKRPMDLKTIKTRIKDGIITNSLEFQRDIYLMFANAMMYNRPGSDIYQMAEDMMLESEQHISAFRQTEGYVRVPSRT